MTRARWLGRWSATLWLSICVSAAPAPAQGDADAEAERVRLYREAQRLGDSGDWAAARERLARVVEIRSAPKALIALAYAELQLGKLLRSRTLYSRARDDARTESLTEDVEAAEVGLRHVARLLPQVTLTLPANVAPHELRVTLDGKPVVVRDGQFVADPGRWRMVVAVLGREPFSKEIELATGSREKIVVEFPTASESVREDPWDDRPDATGGESQIPWGPLVLGGMGAVATGVGALVWLGGNSDYQSVVDECGGAGSSCPASKQSVLAPRAEDARDRIVTGQLITGVGGVALVGAAIWWVASAGSSSGERSTASGFIASPTPTGFSGSVWATF